MQEETRDPAICVGQQVGSEQESPPDALPSPHSTDPGLRAVAFCTASNAQLKKLETIQAQALRICCGAAHGTATAAVQNECGEMPLHLRWLGDSVKEGVKIVTSKDHAATEVMMDHWTLHMDKFQEGKEPLFQRTREFFFELSEVQGAGELVPWKKRRIKIDLSLTKSIDKKTVSPAIQKTLSLELIDRYRNHTCIYTNGSKYEDTAAAAVSSRTSATEES